MIVVRDVFQLKFGKAREALKLWQEGSEFLRQGNKIKDMRLLTDVAGPFYTLVLETSYDALADYENEMKQSMTDEWRSWYQRFVPLVDRGHREIFNVIGSAIPPLPTAADRGRKEART